MSDRQIAAHASDLIVAGSDTSASAMATCIYYLLQEPAMMAILQREIRRTFERFEDINGQSTSFLPYLNAVIHEALRIYPPLPLGLPRLVPTGGVLINGVLIPEGVSTTAFGCTPPAILTRPGHRVNESTGDLSFTNKFPRAFTVQAREMARQEQC